MLPRSFLRAAVGILLFLGVEAVANADLELDLIGDTMWDRKAAPSGPSPIVFGIHSNNLAPSANQLNAFNVGIRIVADPGASGLLSLQSVAIPATKRVFPSYAIPPVLAPAGDVLTVSAENAAFANVTVPGSGANLFEAKFVSSGNNAIGKFSIFADRATTNYFLTTEFDGLKFGNVPDFGDPQGVYLGSITVSFGAVPEPSSLILFSVSGCAVMYLRRRKLAQRSNASSEEIPVGMTKLL